LVFLPNSSQISESAVKKGVQIYRYFVTINEFFRKSHELVNAFPRSIEEMNKVSMDSKKANKW